MDQVKTLVKNTTEVVKVIFSKEENNMDSHYKNMKFETKPAAYKNINSSSINILK